MKAYPNQPILAVLHRGCLIVTWVLITAMAHAQETAPFSPVGDVFPIYQNEAHYHGDPHASLGLFGNFIVVWESRGSDGMNVHARLFDWDGEPYTDEFNVNAHEIGEQRNPRVANVQLEGVFAVVWESRDQAAEDSSLDIYMRLFSAVGEPLTGEILVNETVDSQQKEAEIDANVISETIVVVWQSHDPNTNDFDIFYRRFDAEGNPLGGETKVNTLGGNNYNARVSIKSAGRFVIVWENNDGDASDIYFRRFSSDGEPLDAVEQRINFAEDGNHNDPGIGLTLDDRFFVVWDSDYEGALNVYGQQFDPDGTPIAGNFKINDTPIGNNPEIASDLLGNFVVAWENPLPGADEIRVRSFDSDGNPEGPSVLVYSEEAHHGVPHIALDPLAISFVVVWERTHADGTTGVYGRLFEWGDPETMVRDAWLH